MATENGSIDAKRESLAKENESLQGERGDLAYKLFKEHGFTWGGDWNNPKDYQHFEKKLY